MAALTGNSVASSYQGLLKTSDNAAINATLKNMTDGDGNATPLSMANNYLQVSTETIEFVESTGGTNLMMISPTNVYFEGAVDFTNASVTGIGGGAPGLVAGTGADSMQSAATLTTTAANAIAAGSIALGNGATATTLDDIAIGNGAVTSADGTDPKIAIGQNANASHTAGVAIGENAKGHWYGTAVGFGATTTTKGFAVALGYQASVTQDYGLALGADAAADGNRSVAIGNRARAAAIYSTSIGYNSDANNSNSVALGYAAQANADNAVALGAAVTAAKVDTVSMKALELQTPSTPTAGGIIVTDAGLTERRLNIDASGSLLIDSTPVGGGAAGLVAGTGTDSIKSADTLTTLAAEATGIDSIGLGNNARSRANNSIVIGNGLVDDAIRVNTVVIGSNDITDTKAAQYSTAIGSGAKAVGGNAIALGYVANASNNFTISISATENLTNSNQESVFIGNGSGTTFAAGSSKNVMIGWETKGAALNSVAIGRGAKATGSWSSALAYNAEATGEQSTAVSYGSKATAQGTFAAADRAQATGSRAVAIGGQSTSALADAVVLGPGLTALWAAGTTVNQLAMVNYAAINYADDTAAAAGGVPLGGVYHNAGSLRVRIA